MEEDIYHDTIMDFGISTDLVPSLLDMYDALYARLSEPAADDQDQEVEESADAEKCLHNGHLSEEERADGEHEPKDSPQSFSYLLRDISSQVSYANPTTSTPFPAVPEGSYNVPTTPRHSQTKDSSRNEVASSIMSGCLYDNLEPKLVRSSLSPTTITTTTTTISTTSTHTTTTNTPAHAVSSTHSHANARKHIPNADVQNHRLSSSSSASSSSSSSLTKRMTIPQSSAAGSCLASVESLVYEEIEEDNRRRERSLKIRREKGFRQGLGDSSFQCSSISLPAPPPLPRPRYFDNNLAKMDRTVLEIVDTEAIYVRDLRQVIEGYLDPWRRGDERCITKQQVEELFSNIEEIYAFNKSFLSQLECCGVNPVSVARCFVSNNKGFAIYTHYCTNYPRTVSLLTELMRGTSALAFREKQTSLGHSLPLGSYLLKPVQRILKYHLLLGNIVKLIEEEGRREGEAGKEEVQAALLAMTGMARHINEMKRRHEHAVRVQEIQSLLYGWEYNDLTTYGELAAEGTFRMCGAKGVRHVFLFDRMMLIAKKKEEGVLVYKTHIMCSNLMLIESVRGEPLSFHVIPFDNPRLQYTLQARNLDQKREWTLQLKRVILENYTAAIPAHARQLVMELGQNAGGESGHVGGRRGPHHAPEYLERRKADRERRRSADTVLNASRLRLRRSGRSRKIKEEEKGPRSRSVSRTRETEEEEEEEEEDEEDLRKTSTASTPTSLEKPRLKLSNMWGRRRSEPGVITRSMPTTPTTPATPTTTATQPQPRLHMIPQRLEVSNDGFSLSECEIEEEDEGDSISGRGRDAGSCDSGGGENLEEIVGGLLQHSLRLQQLLLSKPRRRRLLQHYATSDSEGDDSSLPTPTLLPPTKPPPPPPDLGDYVDFYFNRQLESSSEASMYSSALSVQANRSIPTTNSTSWDSQDRSVKELRRARSFNMETPADEDVGTISDIWIRNSDMSRECVSVRDWDRGSSYSRDGSSKGDSSRGSVFERLEDRGSSYSRDRVSKVSGVRDTGGRMQDRGSNYSRDDLNKGNISRDSANDRIGYRGDTNSHSGVRDSANDQGDSFIRGHSDRGSLGSDRVDRGEFKAGVSRERPVTIALSGSSRELRDLASVLGPSQALAQTDTDASITPPHSIEDLMSLNNPHPAHRIYHPATPYSSSGTLLSAFGPAVGVVGTVARQCTKSLKARIKQIKEDSATTAPSPTSATQISPYSRQGSAEIGARLALGSENSEHYATPMLLKTKPIRDSLLSSSSSSSSSSTRPILTSPPLSPLPPSSPDSEGAASADSFYERCFEEEVDDPFRDSAIYSDPDEDAPHSPAVSPTRTHSPSYPTSTRSQSLSPVSSTARFGDFKAHSPPCTTSPVYTSATHSAPHPSTISPIHNQTNTQTPTVTKPHNQTTSTPTKQPDLEMKANSTMLTTTHNLTITRPQDSQTITKSTLTTLTHNQTTTHTHTVTISKPELRTDSKTTSPHTRTQSTITTTPTRPKPQPNTSPTHPRVTRKPTPCPTSTPIQLSVTLAKKTPPPIPAKPDGRTRGRPAPRTQNSLGMKLGVQKPNPRSASAPPRPRPVDPQIGKGWVRHVIGRLQAGGGEG